MLNNGELSGGSHSGMGTPDGTNGGGGGGSMSYMGNSPAPEYPPASSSSSMLPNPHYNPHPHPHLNNGPMMPHHGGGICSQMALNRGPFPPDSKPCVCAGCGETILEKYIYQLRGGVDLLDKFWHYACLRCNHCGVSLPELGESCFSRGGLILCRRDFLRMFGMKGCCAGCGQHIPAEEMVMRTGVMPGPRMVFHVHCFCCSKCNKTLSTGDRYSIFNGALICEQDALKLMKQNGIGSPSNSNVATTNGPTTAPRKGKVGRPRRSRD